MQVINQGAQLAPTTSNSQPANATPPNVHSGTPRNPYVFQVDNTQYYRDMPFEEYLKIEGVSFSSIKGFNGTPSEGMRLGTRVHNYLNEPALYDWEQAELVRPIAGAVRGKLGTAYKYMEKELAFTSEFHYMGMILKYKGRADLIKVNNVLVDYKVLAGGLDSAIERFGYDKQISGYCLATGCRLGIIIAWNKAKRKIETRTITPDPTFWMHHVVKLGRPSNQ